MKTTTAVAAVVAVVLASGAESLPISHPVFVHPTPTGRRLQDYSNSYYYVPNTANQLYVPTSTGASPTLLSNIPIVGGLFDGGVLDGGFLGLGSGGGLSQIVEMPFSLVSSLLGGDILASLPVVGGLSVGGMGADGLLGSILSPVTGLFGGLTGLPLRRLQEAQAPAVPNVPTLTGKAEASAKAVIAHLSEAANILKDMIATASESEENAQVYQQMLDLLINADKLSKITADEKDGELLAQQLDLSNAFNNFFGTLVSAAMSGAVSGVSNSASSMASNALSDLFSTATSFTSPGSSSTSSPSADVLTTAASQIVDFITTLANPEVFSSILTLLTTMVPSDGLTSAASSLMGILGGAETTHSHQAPTHRM